jgi:uncharacterized membrane protein
MPMLIAIGLGAAMSCSADTPTSVDPGPGPYFDQVRQIVADNCLSCHSSTGSWVGRPVAFDTDAQIEGYAQSIKAVVADPVTPQNPRMPQDHALTARQIGVIIAWARNGGRTTD